MVATDTIVALVAYTASSSNFTMTVAWGEWAYTSVFNEIGRFRRILPDAKCISCLEMLDAMEVWFSKTVTIIIGKSRMGGYIPT